MDREGSQGGVSVADIGLGQAIPLEEPVEEERLRADYLAMSADREREEVAEEWSEAMIGDSSEAQ
jgi:hypothetical protein